MSLYKYTYIRTYLYIILVAFFQWKDKFCCFTIKNCNEINCCFSHSPLPYFYTILLLTSVWCPGDHLKEKDDSQPSEGTKDNRSLIDNNKAQSLSSEDIDAMRRLGHSFFILPSIGCAFQWVTLNSHFALNLHCLLQNKNCLNNLSI